MSKPINLNARRARKRKRGPFHDNAILALDAGWHPIPLPPKAKWPPPEGFTGENGRLPDRDQVEEWLAEYESGSNWAVRLDKDVIGIDVDHYDTKTGLDTLREFEAEHGVEFPETWIFTARKDGKSGIRLYKLPDELVGKDWPGKLGPSIEIIQWRHRYAIGPGSVHDKVPGAVYRAYAPGDPLDGESYTDELPNVFDLPELPLELGKAIVDGRLGRYLPKWDGKVGGTEVKNWLVERPNPDEMCSQVRRTLDNALNDLRNEKALSAHERMNDAVHALVLLANEGHSGVKKALGRIQRAFVKELAEDRKSDVKEGKRTTTRVLDPVTAKQEYVRSLFGAYRIAKKQILDDPNVFPVESCFCSSAGVEIEPDERGRMPKEPFEYGRNDRGMAEQIDDWFGADYRWVPNWKLFAKWHESAAGGAHWYRVEAYEIQRLIFELVDRMKARAGDLMKESKAMKARGDDRGAEIAEERAQNLWKFAEVYSNKNKVNAATETFKGLEGIPHPAEQFDAQPALLNCSNGMLELRRVYRGPYRSPDQVADELDDSVGQSYQDAVVFRPAAREDYCSLSTGIPYHPWDDLRMGGPGEHFLPGRAAWESYLDLFIPDLELRRYVQKLFGLALFGDNEEQLIAFLIGPPASGKSTILEAVAAALGEYAGPAALSLFRERKDPGGADPELLGALPRRIVYSSEAGEWHLHSDRIKHITGGERMTARGLYSGTFLDRVPAFTPFVATNGVPTIQGADAALWRRLVAIPFNQSLTEVESLRGKMDASARGFLRGSLAGRVAILSWCVEGWRMYSVEGFERGENQPLAVAKAMLDFRDNVSDFHTFLRESIEVDVGPKNYVVFAEYYKFYKGWAEYNGLKAMPKNVFSNKIKGEGLEIGRKKLRSGSQSKTPVILNARLIMTAEDLDSDVRTVTPIDGDDED